MSNLIKALTEAWSPWAVGLAVIIGYTLSKGLYNLYLHPLRHIPGPKLAAFSRHYQFWFDAIGGGRYLWEMGRMHDEYGPIIRIGPDEVHVRDPSYYSTIYSSGSRKVDKDPVTTSAFNLPQSTISTIDHDHHRARRSYLSPYFSKRASTSFQPIIDERVTKLFQRFEGFMASGEVVNLDHAFAALTGDIVCKRMYGKHFDYLDVPNFRVFATEAVSAVCRFYHIARFFPRLVKSIRESPLWLQRALLPPLAGLHRLQEDFENQLKSVSNNPENAKVEGAILSALIDPLVPPGEKTIVRLVNEAATILMAGTETTARACSVAMFYLLHDPETLERLREELATLPAHADNQFPLSLLEPLKYLNGVVKESVRLSFGPITPFPRVPKVEHLQYKDHIIPAGTTVSQSTYFVHTDPSIYPEPFRFNPDRWIDAEKEGRNLQNFLVSFTKGTRQCIGMQLAYAELFITLARVVLSFDMELYNTTTLDVVPYCANILPCPKRPWFDTSDLGQIKVKVTGRRSI